jgi:hypothetical protein
MKKKKAAAVALALVLSLNLSSPAMANRDGWPRLCTTSMNFVYNMMEFLSGKHAWAVLFEPGGKCTRR